MFVAILRMGRKTALRKNLRRVTDCREWQFRWTPGQSCPQWRHQGAGHSTTNTSSRCGSSRASTVCCWRQFPQCQTSSQRGCCSSTALQHVRIATSEWSDRSWPSCLLSLTTRDTGNVCAPSWTFLWTGAICRATASLPLSLGGMGLRSTQRTRVAAYWASWSDPLPMIWAILGRPACDPQAKQRLSWMGSRGLKHCHGQIWQMVCALRTANGKIMNQENLAKGGNTKRPAKWNRISWRVSSP